MWTVFQIVLILGISILLVSTYTTLSAQDKGHVQTVDSSGSGKDSLPQDNIVEKLDLDKNRTPALQGRRLN
jgi:hypothetical protein